MNGYTGNNVPEVDASCGRHVMNRLSGAIEKGCVWSCHDCSDGGMAVSLAEMAFAGGLGMSIRLGAFEPPKGQGTLRNDLLLFSESNTRFIVEIRDENKFLKAMKSIPVWRLGHVRNDRAFKIFGNDERLIVDTDIDRLKAAWQYPFRNL